MAPRRVLTMKSVAEQLLEEKRAESRSLFSEAVRSEAAKLRKMKITRESWAAFIELARHAGLSTVTLAERIGVPRRRVRRWRRGQQWPSTAGEAETVMRVILELIG